MSELETVFTENLDFVESLYATYLEHPEQVDPAWRSVFASIGPGVKPRGSPFAPRSIFNPISEAPPPPPGTAPLRAPAREVTITGTPLSAALRQARVQRLVDAYRLRGHLAASLDPLGTQHDPRPHPELETQTYNLREPDLDEIVLPSRDVRAFTGLKIRELVASLRETYCRHLGVELAAIDEMAEREWLLERMEPTGNHREFSRAQQLRILERLVAAEGLERFLHTKYVGTKRFSLEGAEGLIPLLDLLIEQAGLRGFEEIVFGMTHRGRLNVLVNVLGKEPAELLAEFEDLDPESTLGSGDVKYHLGFSHDYTTLGGKKIHLSLTFNPSHLEAIDPVVCGRVRAKQDRFCDEERGRCLPVLLHGDAAFAGQGLVAETFNLAMLKGYRTGGTIHIVVNNQIGFTTSPKDSRSTIYATDVALASHVPIFHVNGEDPEAIGQAVALAVDYRQTFRKDVVIDMYCYRKYGHNETDEPSFTQPLLYKSIDAHPSAIEVYTKKLVHGTSVTQADLERIQQDNQAFLEKAFERVRETRARPQVNTLGGIWRFYLGGSDAKVPEVDTSVELPVLEELLGRLVALPSGFRAHPKILRLLDARAEMRTGQKPLDWGAGEALAFASLLVQGTRVRLSGQDSRRGTFSHRHSVLTDIESGAEYAPLANLKPGQAAFNVYDSALSEAGVFGFDYGYALESPDALVLWEAQFGDFANGAQIMIDNYLSAAEDKWKRLCGIVLLLPHGFEGQGPEHSSARIERWLTLCAEDNMQVCQPTTPAQLFHVLRRQVVRIYRKPLVVFTPKSLLRHPKAISSLDELAHGRFERVIPDRSVPSEGVRRAIVCTGKSYYELAARREKLGRSDVAVIRLEQLYPFPDEGLAGVLAGLPNLADVTWYQEEPANMGALGFLSSRWARVLPRGVALRAVSRPESASPATGSSKAHAIEQEMLLKEAFA
jgi:2-oxoglutarate dehydrogenase E1 component